MFNALKYTKKLEEVGLSREQAEAHVQMVIEVMDSNFATKLDFSEMKNEFHAFKIESRSEFAAVRSEMKSEFTILRAELTAIKSELENRLLLKLGSLMAVGFTVLGFLIKFH